MFVLNYFDYVASEVLDGSKTLYKGVTCTQPYQQFVPGDSLGSLLVDHVARTVHFYNQDGSLICCQHLRIV